MPGSSVYTVEEEINEPEEEGTPQVYGTPEQESPHLSGATNDQPQGSGFHTFSSYQTQTTSSQFYGSEFVRDTYTPSPTSAGPRPCPPQKKSKTSAGQKWEKSLDRVCELIEIRTKHAFDVSPKKVIVPTITECMDLLMGMTAIPRDACEWSFAAKLMKDAKNRKLFVDLCNEEQRARWILLEYNMAMGKLRSPSRGASEREVWEVKQSGRVI
ncbi:hypothetical protein QJS10_CPA02g00851 [Acorus calamus]|uniref:Uncharacterized protein n=1 Tax=Acorus calamus TaxID=4465 RepID=A0AAV9FC06_ACOCL|nr:hypothetical protein QJS10_CPA02g00851 [Acorus calamus]